MLYHIYRFEKDCEKLKRKEHRLTYQLRLQSINVFAMKLITKDFKKIANENISGVVLISPRVSVKKRMLQKVIRIIEQQLFLMGNKMFSFFDCDGLNIT